MELVYSIFLLTSAWYDLKIKKIPLWILGVFGCAGLLSLFSGSGNGWAGMAAFLPGILLLILTVCTGGAAGAGDGCFFIVSACYLGLSQTVTLFICSVLFCGTCSLGMAAWGITHGINAGKMRLPFIPFVIPAWLWLMFCRIAVG